MIDFIHGDPHTYTNNYKQNIGKVSVILLGSKV